MFFIIPLYIINTYIRSVYSCFMHLINCGIPKHWSSVFFKKHAERIYEGIDDKLDGHLTQLLKDGDVSAKRNRVSKYTLRSRPV